MKDATIAAIATPVGRGGIGIVRISGPQSLSIAALIFRKHPPEVLQATSAPPTDLASLKSHYLYHGYIVNPQGGTVIDEVLMTAMRAPRSYTREDVIEFQSHAGPLILQQILTVVLEAGARLAEPGEFTRRAFINGRIDLTQAEAVMDMISARTDKALQVASNQMVGALRHAVMALRDAMVHLHAEVEADIEFGDSDGLHFNTAESAATLESRIEPRLEGLLANWESGHVLRDGLKLAIVGRPNVGKSSLLNRLVQKERAIVTAWPGTTRDFIEETISIRGIPVVIGDTAGMHDSVEPLEQLGIQKTHEYVSTADLVLLMIDAAAGVTAADADIYDRIAQKPGILVFNKIDLMGGRPAPQVPEGWGAIPVVSISALYGQGVEHLKDQIAALSLGTQRPITTATIVPNLRQKMALEEALSETRDACQALKQHMPLDMIALHLQAASEALGRILGIDVQEDILDQIFSQFCIGK